ncbi:hypothetical protein TPHA_0P01480 [Tetrapisispora phaffii CBS 4417]|uniref:Mediator of RNA polymerase II transcription subunit 7 n=1 Tax=Tetrapisispora phaffii (strain ATCC 24235 / CBS 4417 / NBRC 1672 / NRRL Y-8282 / UCD 70-5) TaxID=1071381 RepID=G8C2C8_TETPH|nr:hypothetical protein TPHA_0P01480 [Tetrapisispora phaffii CBS 4417]CCE66306.1 hypothetical protein TPHA_0P01480 [Tetrapisispora phaffii CBS 4417]
MSNNDNNDISSLYPPPPPYIKFFTDENVEKLEEYQKGRKRDDVDGGTNGELANEDRLETALDFLIPPPIPTSGQYRVFGSTWQVKDKLPDLESMGLTQLYKKSDQDSSADDQPREVDYQYKIQELRKLLKSLLLNYLELVGILSINPDKFEEKVVNIKTILVNIHHLLNAYRPHQSRESLIMLLEAQLEYKKGEIEHIKSVCKQVKDKLEEIKSIKV